MSMRRRSVIAGVITLLLVVDAIMATSSSSTAATSRSEHAAAALVQGSPLLAYVGPSKTQSIVWIARLTGAMKRRLGPGEQPLISPDGGYYVAAGAINFKGGALLVYSTEGGSPRQFFDGANATATALAWSPNGRYLAVALLGTAVNNTRGSGLEVIDTQTWTATMVAKGIINGASFDPSGAPELVYGSAPSQLVKDPSNLQTVSVDGGKSTPLTHDGRSLNPVWGSHGILFDRERLRGVAKAPEYQVWLMRGAHVEQLTSVKVSALVDGLVPLEVSADGNRIVAAYVGEDTDEAWTIQVSPRKVAQITRGQDSVQPAGISSDGTRVLVDVGSFEQAPSYGTVDTLPFGGGSLFKVAAGADASWNS